jgi:hypothetical protein
MHLNLSSRSIGRLHLANVKAYDILDMQKMLNPELAFTNHSKNLALMVSLTTMPTMRIYAFCCASFFFLSFTSLSLLQCAPHRLSANINGMLQIMHKNASSVYVHPAFNFVNIGWVTALPPAPNQHLTIFNYNQ